MKMEVLHNYNDFKDTAHRLLGLLGERHAMTVRDLYQQFGVEEDSSR